MSTEKIEEFVEKEFIQENIASCKKRHKKGGPYSKQDRKARRNEVFRLHFEYGYPAIKIAEMMKVNRNTINGDIQYWYYQVSKKWKSADPTIWVRRYIERLELQKTRLREELDKAKNIQEKISVERLILDVESKMLQTQLKLLESLRLDHESATKWINDWMKKNKHKDRLSTCSDIFYVSAKSREKIMKIIKDDRNGIGVY